MCDQYELHIYLTKCSVVVWFVVLVQIKRTEVQICNLSQISWKSENSR